MKFVGIDLHKAFLVVAVEDGQGPVGKPKRLSCRDEDAIVEHFKSLVPFQAVIEASCSYRWLYERLSVWGEVVLAHPYRLRAIVSARAKTDKLGACKLAEGENELRLSAVGKADASKGYGLGLDAVVLWPDAPQ